MPNKYKGTFEAEIAGETYTLRPSFDAMIEFEELTGKLAGDASQELMDGKISFKTVVGAIYAGIKGESYNQNNPHLCPAYRVLGEKMSQDGIQKYAVIASKFLIYGTIPNETIEKLENGELDTESTGDEKKRDE